MTDECIGSVIYRESELGQNSTEFTFVFATGHESIVKHLENFKFLVVSQSFTTCSESYSREHLP